jgi:hypothetical protein
MITSIHDTTLLRGDVSCATNGRTQTISSLLVRWPSFCGVRFGSCLGALGTPLAWQMSLDSSRQSGQPKRVLSICCAALLWTIWNIRNKFTIERYFPSQPADALYKLSMYLQVWRPVARQRDRAVLDVMIRRIRVLHLEQRDG